MFGRKRKIEKLQNKLENRDKFLKDLLQANDTFIRTIDDMEDEIQYLKKLVKNLNEDLSNAREQSFEYANKIKRPNLAKQNKKHLV